MTKSEMIKYLSDIRSYYGTYHNHKEVSAWGAVMIVIIFQLQVINGLNTLRCVTEWYQYALYAFTLFPAITICFYVYAQQSGKKIAANIVAACLVLEIKMLGIKSTEFKESDYPLGGDDSETVHAKRFLPKFLMAKVNEIDKGKKGYIGFILDASRYFLVVFVTAFALIRIRLLHVA